MTDLRPLKIMIVEDEALIAMDLESVLEALGHTIVAIASNSGDAITMGRAFEPDLALVDIHLQDGVTGIAVAEALVRGGKTFVVFTTANASRIPDHYAGAVGCLGKPYTEGGVRAALSFLSQGIIKPPPVGCAPTALTLSPKYLAQWAL
jgi:CheY-like chemotaxis protein